MINIKTAWRIATLPEEKQEIVFLIGNRQEDKKVLIGTYSDMHITIGHGYNSDYWSVKDIYAWMPLAEFLGPMSWWWNPEVKVVPHNVEDTEIAKVVEDTVNKLIKAGHL